MHIVIKYMYILSCLFIYMKIQQHNVQHYKYNDTLLGAIKIHCIKKYQNSNSKTAKIYVYPEICISSIPIETYHCVSRMVDITFCEQVTMRNSLFLMRTSFPNDRTCYILAVH